MFLCAMLVFLCGMLSYNLASALVGLHHRPQNDLQLVEWDVKPYYTIQYCAAILTPSGSGKLDPIVVGVRGQTVCLTSAILGRISFR